MNDYNFESVRELNYLGTTITEDSIGLQEKNKMIQAGNRFLCTFQNVVKLKLLTRPTKVNLYKTVITSVEMYGSEK